MAEDILDDIARIRRLMADTAREHDNGKEVGAQLVSMHDELTHLMDKVEARFETMSRESLDEKTKFVSDLAGKLLQTRMELRDGTVGASDIDHAVDIASAIVSRVKERH